MEIRTTPPKVGIKLPAFETYIDTLHFGSLNGLRFFCIFAVLWHHGPVWTGLASSPRLLGSGFFGVDFFFVLSGFLITTLLLREEARDGSFSLRGFYWRCFLRIIPVYFLVVTVLALYFIGIKGQTDLLRLLPFYYLFLSNFLVAEIPLLAPTWSLAVEEQYYLIWPLLLLLLPRRMILHALVILIGINVVLGTGVFGSDPLKVGPLEFKMFTATYAPILIGSALAVILNSRSGFSMLAQVLGHRVAAPIAFFVLLGVIAMRPADVAGWPNLLIHMVMAACLASIVIREDHALRAMLTYRPFVRIGEISYGIYLYHLIALYLTAIVLAKLGLESEWVTFVSYSIIAIGISELSFRYFESPLLKFRRGRSRKAEIAT